MTRFAKVRTSTAGTLGSRSARAAGATVRRAAVAAALFAVTRFVIGGAHRVPSPSMAPAIQEGDLVFAEKASIGALLPVLEWRLPRLRAPHRGEVVLFRVPYDAATIYIKRMAGVAGDTVSMRDGMFTINGRRDVLLSRDSAFLDRLSDPADFVWHEPFLIKDAGRPFSTPTARDWGPLLVPANHVFVLGDNRGHSRDSRQLGFIPDSLIVGRALFVYSRAGRLVAPRGL